MIIGQLRREGRSKCSKPLSPSMTTRALLAMGKFYALSVVFHLTIYILEKSNRKIFIRWGLSCPQVSCKGNPSPISQSIKPTKSQRDHSWLPNP